MMVATNQLHGLGTPPMIRVQSAGGPVFTDPKLNAMREAAIAGNWAALFRIAPTAWRKASDPIDRENFLYWHQNNPLRRPLSLADLRVTVQNGRIVKVPFAQSELENYFTNYHPAKPGFACTQEQIRKWTKRVLNGNGKYLFPSEIFCKPEKSSRRKKKIVKVIKKAAIVGAAVTGGVILGRYVVGKAGAVLAAKGGTAAATAAAASGAAGTAATAAQAGGLVAAAAKALPLGVSVINSTRTIKALKNGELPPPPISIGDGSFSDYAGLVATELAQRELGQRVTASEQALIDEYVEQERRRLAAAEEPHLPVVNSALDPTLTNAQKQRADAALGDNNLLKVAAIGIPLTVLAVRAMA